MRIASTCMAVLTGLTVSFPSYADPLLGEGGPVQVQIAVPAVILGVQDALGKAGVVAVNNDVDLYDEPGGSGHVIGMLEGNTLIGLKRCRDDNWCEVDGGWVWGDFLNR